MQVFACRFLMFALSMIWGSMGHVPVAKGRSFLQGHMVERETNLLTDDVEDAPGKDGGKVFVEETQDAQVKEGTTANGMDGDLDTTNIAAHHEGSWASGCSSIYLDVGSNVGVQIRKLFEPLKYPQAQILPIFETHFGPIEVRTKPSIETGLCAFGFEANPNQLSRLKQIEKTYNARGWRVKFMAPFVVDIVDGQQIPFNIAGSGPGKAQDLGSSVAMRSDTHNTVNVNTLDFPAFLEKEIFSVSPKKVIMKMDIEGSEFVVLPELTRRNYLCRERVDEILMEWHDYKDGVKDKIRNNVWPTKQNVQTEVVKQACQSGVTELADVDDETYWDDGKPLL